MAFNLNSGMFDMLLSPLIWLLVVGVIVILGVGMLWVMKQKRLQYNCLIFTDLGNKKQGIEKMKAGWFSTRSKLRGLIQLKGEQILMTKDGRRIQGGSSVDFHEIGNRRGLLLKRKDDDPKILVPITTLEITNLELLGTVAPVEIRDAAVQIVNQDIQETKSNWEVIGQWIIMGGLIIFALVSIILITRMVQHGQDEAGRLIMEAAKGCGSAIVKSSAP